MTRRELIRRGARSLVLGATLLAASAALAAEPARVFVGRVRFDSAGAMASLEALSLSRGIEARVKDLGSPLLSEITLASSLDDVRRQPLDACAHASCLAEIAAAYGAPYALFTSARELDGACIVTATLMETEGLEMVANGVVSGKVNDVCSPSKLYLEARARVGELLERHRELLGVPLAPPKPPGASATDRMFPRPTKLTVAPPPGWARIPAGEAPVSRPFLLKTTEVTQGEWRALMGTDPSYFRACGDDCPVERVSWWDAAAYCNALSSQEGLLQCYNLQGCRGEPGRGLVCRSAKLRAGLDCPGYRLPTAAEWEHAARARPVGDPPPVGTVAWTRTSGGRRPHPVGGKPANTWKLHDMLGNVWEWVHDGPDDPGPEAAIRGPRWRRGCGWSSQSASCTLEITDGYSVRWRNADLGFRPARTLK